jgi:S-DNA-T family DNA segregation ATPase FtsK/SpoIIIE
MLKVSVAEVRNALRCPRIFALGRAQRREVGFPVSASCLGAAFHRIVANFAQSPSKLPPLALLAGYDAATLDERLLSGALAAALLDLAAGEIARNPSYASMPAEVDELAEALRELAQYLSQELKAMGGGVADGLAQFLAGSELDVGDTVDLGGGEAVLLSGRLDALHARSTDSLGVLEFKLAAESCESLDRAQVALYRHLLRESHALLEAEPVVLRFQPQLTVTQLGAEAADTLTRERLLPLLGEMVRWANDGASAPGPEQPDLCPSCPVRAACAASYPAYLPSRDQPPASAARSLPDAKGESTQPPVPTEPAGSRVDDRAGREEAEELQHAVERFYRGRGVAVQLGESKVGARLVSVALRARRGPVRNLDHGAEQVVQQLEAELRVQASYVRSAGHRRIELVRKTPRRVLLTSVLERAGNYLRERPGRFVLGEDSSGDPLRGDLSEPACCHLLIGGAPGSGKSTLLRSVIASLAHYHPPDEIRFTLVDPKRDSFAEFRSSLGAHLAHPICFEVSEAIEILEGLVNEMEERYEAFEEAGVEDLEGYNEAVGTDQRIARHVVVVDEFADLLATKSMREAFLNSVQRLCAKARAAGIHLLLATERPEAKTVPGVIKTNLVGRIALKVGDVAASRIMIGQAGAELLLGKGDLYADFGAGPVRAQAALLGVAP